MKIEKIIKILKKELKKFKDPTVKKISKNKDPFKTLISCLLSLRTKDKNTAKASKSLFKVANTPEKIAKLPLKKLEKLIYCSGFYKNKARTIKQVSKILIQKYNSKVPSTRKELLKIKGIGRKTANIILCFAFNKKVIPVDTHLHMISNRLGLVKTKNPEQTEQKLMKVVPKKYWPDLNTLFVLFGQKICTSVSPICSKCPLKNLCPKINVTKHR